VPESLPSGPHRSWLERLVEEAGWAAQAGNAQTARLIALHKHARAAFAQGCPGVTFIIPQSSLFQPGPRSAPSNLVGANGFARQDHCSKPVSCHRERQAQLKAAKRQLPGWHHHCMGVLFDYFSAVSDEAAASAIDLLGGPGVPLAGPSQLGAAMVNQTWTPKGAPFDTVPAEGIDPLVQLGTLEALLTGRDYEQIVAGPRAGQALAIRDGCSSLEGTSDL
jgi:hypothetical protein